MLVHRRYLVLLAILVFASGCQHDPIAPPSPTDATDSPTLAFDARLTADAIMAAAGWEYDDAADAL